MPIFTERAGGRVVRSSFRQLPTMAELQTFFAWSLEQMRRHGHNKAVILDIRTAATPPLDHLKAQAAFLRENAETISERVLGVVFVADSPMLRGALKALFWMQEPPTQAAVVRELEAARAQVNTWLAEAGARASIPVFNDDASVHGERLDPSAHEPA